MSQQLGQGSILQGRSAEEVIDQKYDVPTGKMTEEQAKEKANEYSSYVSGIWEALVKQGNLTHEQGYQAIINGDVSPDMVAAATGRKQAQGFRSQVFEGKEVGIPAGAPAPEAQLAQDEGRLAEGQVA
jgi:polyhydroxyalkanoate synthesis regulator phasin